MSPRLKETSSASWATKSNAALYAYKKDDRRIQQNNKTTKPQNNKTTILMAI